MLAIVVLLIFGIGYLASNRSNPTQPLPNGNSSFPTSTNNPGGTQTQQNTISVKTQTGGQINVTDFKRAQGTTADSSNTGSYYLAGPLLLGQPDPEYTIMYSDIDQSFNISLWVEPLRVTRTKAEQELLRALSIQPQEACMLTYSVLVPYSVNPLYASKQLGFSFCADSVTLP